MEMVEAGRINGREFIRGKVVIKSSSRDPRIDSVSRSLGPGYGKLIGPGQLLNYYRKLMIFKLKSKTKASHLIKRTLIAMNLHMMCAYVCC